jgi:uncharacterized protein with PQ loop repeat
VAYIVDQHKRKRAKSKKDPFPHPSRGRRFLDTAVIWLGIGNIIATLPQVIEIFANKDASGVSSISWGYYTFFYIILTFYGVVHKEKPLIITYAGGTVLFAVIFAGSLLY